MEELKNKFREESTNLKKEVREKTISYIMGALGLVAGLAWNEAIKSMIDYFLPATENGLWAKLIYAILVTILIVIVSTYLLRLSSKEK